MKTLAALCKKDMERFPNIILQGYLLSVITFNFVVLQSWHMRHGKHNLLPSDNSQLFLSATVTMNSYMFLLNKLPT